MATTSLEPASVTTRILSRRPVPGERHGDVRADPASCQVDLPPGRRLRRRRRRPTRCRPGRRPRRAAGAPAGHPRRRPRRRRTTTRTTGSAPASRATVCQPFPPGRSIVGHGVAGTSYVPGRGHRTTRRRGPARRTAPARSRPSVRITGPSGASAVSSSAARTVGCDAEDAGVGQVEQVLRAADTTGSSSDPTAAAEPPRDLVDLDGGAGGPASRRSRRESPRRRLEVRSTADLGSERLRTRSMSGRLLQRLVHQRRVGHVAAGDRSLRTTTNRTPARRRNGARPLEIRPLGDPASKASSIRMLPGGASGIALRTAHRDSREVLHRLVTGRAPHVVGEARSPARAGPRHRRRCRPASRGLLPVARGREAPGRSVVSSAGDRRERAPITPMRARPTTASRCEGQPDGAAADSRLPTIASAASISQARPSTIGSRMTGSNLCTLRAGASTPSRARVSVGEPALPPALVTHGHQEQPGSTESTRNWRCGLRGPGCPPDRA